MNKKNYKTNLKRSFIICGIMFVVILLIFVFATSVNNNVAENMTGKLLYMNEGKDGMELLVHDFDSDKSCEVSGFHDEAGVEYAQFLNEDSVCVAVLNDTTARIAACAEDSSQVRELLVIEDVKRIISFETDRSREKILIAYELVNGNTAAKIFNSQNEGVTDLFEDNEKEITAVCFNYDGDGVYVSAKGKNTLVYTGSLSLECSIEGEAELVCAWEKGFILSRKDEYEYMYKFYSSAGSESKLKFCEGNNTYGICLITKDKFIAGSDKEGNGDIYVCNGSNMDPVKEINNELLNIPLDYKEASDE